jgi:hypothetical protein
MVGELVARDEAALQHKAKLLSGSADLRPLHGIPNTDSNDALLVLGVTLDGGNELVVVNSSFVLLMQTLSEFVDFIENALFSHTHLDVLVLIAHDQHIQ